MAKDYQPIFILPENTQRTTGKNAQRNNILAAKLVSDIVRTTLGPKGMDKMIVDSLGDVIITNDGVTILREMTIEHPAAKMLVEIAKTQEAEVGDGTTTAVILAGELLKNSESLLDQNVHPTVIAKGYKIAAEKAIQILENIAKPLSESDIDTLMKIAVTAITGKEAEASKKVLSGLLVNAVLNVMSKENGRIIIDKNDIKIEKSVGGSVMDSELIEGIVLDKEKSHPTMPTHVKNAKIVLIDSALEIKNTEIDAKIQITDPEKMQAFLDMEEKMIKGMVDKIFASGANVVLCQKGIDDLAQHLLAKKGIYACRRVKKGDMEKLSKATGAKIITELKDLSANDLGHAGVVEEMPAKNEEFMTYIKDCKNAKAVTLLIKGSSEHITAEIQRAMEDAIGDLITALKSGKIVAGAGSCEIEVAKQLREFSESLSGREQLAVKAFADSLEIIPRTLAENAGLDPIDIIIALKSSHDKKQIWAGVDVHSGKVMDAWTEGIIEPLRVKTQAISSAAEVATMILRIDDVIAGSNNNPMQNPQMPQGMPEY
ncbi:TPA: thermosome subunit [Candidatus Woesearchaeota archaeon]|nr:thermosome subunit [Candidatus Woesearchaeota archaeon]HIJ13482.1 thermosome subunit [Candidatus Woesearchaeota archaeon]